MKSPALALVFAAAASLVCTPYVLAATGDYDVCFDLKPGQPCKNAQGQDSRCSHRSVCIENLKECPSGSTLLQSCSKTSEVYCYPLFDGKPLLCLDDVHIETTVQRDVCTGKSDGTPCKNAFTEGNGKAGLTATVYEQDGVCEDSYCMAKLFTTCDNASPGAICTHTGVLGGKRRSFTGKCVKEEPFRAWCKSDSNGVVMGDAKVLVAPAGSSTTTSTTTSTSSTPSPSKTPAPSRASVSSTGSTGGDPLKDAVDKLIDDLLAPLTVKPTPTPTPTKTLPASSSPETSASTAVSIAAVATTILALLTV